MTEGATRKPRGVTTGDIFGEATGAEPATPGSYGRRPDGFRLPSGTRLGRLRAENARTVLSKTDN